jgi:CheY-like chemotaxis protein
VILLDVALGETDGASLAQELSTRPDWRDIPVIALTSDGLDEEVLRMHGFRDELVMPVEQKELLGALDRILENGRRAAAAHLQREGQEEQCRLPLEDRLSCEHLTLFSRVPVVTRVKFRPGNEMRVRRLSKGLGELGVHPELEMEGDDLVLRYELSLADALALEAPAPEDELFTALTAAYPELSTRPEALRRRLGELQDEFRRLHRLAS